MTPNDEAINAVLRQRREAAARDQLQSAYTAAVTSAIDFTSPAQPSPGVGGITYWPPYIPQPTTYPGVCPGCGRCRTCGHPAPAPAPVYPGPFPTPGSPSIIWCASGTADPGGSVANAELTANLNRMPG